MEIKAGDIIKVTDDISLKVIKITVSDWLARDDADILDVRLETRIEFQIRRSDGSKEYRNQSLPDLLATIKASRAKAH